MNTTTLIQYIADNGDSTIKVLFETNNIVTDHFKAISHLCLPKYATSNWEASIFEPEGINGSVINVVRLESPCNSSLSVSMLEPIMIPSGSRTMAGGVARSLSHDCIKDAEEDLVLEIYDSADPSVGLFPASWYINCPFCRKDADAGMLEEFRKAAIDMYSDYVSGKLIATYCFESAARTQAEIEAEK